MGLSNEDRSKLTEAELQVVFSDAAREAKELGQRLVSFERNPDPHTECNLENPAHGVHIRLLRPRPPVFVGYDVENVKMHNEFVSSLGKAGRKFE